MACRMDDHGMARSRGQTRGVGQTIRSSGLLDIVPFNTLPVRRAIISNTAVASILHPEVCPIRESETRTNLSRSSTYIRGGHASTECCLGVGGFSASPTASSGLIFDCQARFPIRDICSGSTLFRYPVQSKSPAPYDTRERDYLRKTE